MARRAMNLPPRACKDPLCPRGWFLADQCCRIARRSAQPGRTFGFTRWAVWSVSSSLQRLQVGDDILAILGIGNADDHLGPMYISRGIGEIFVELLLVPCDASGFEGG